MAKWLYQIPHVWEGDRAEWEDIYLRPDDPSYTGDSIWLTVDAIGKEVHPCYTEAEWRLARIKLGGAAYSIDEAGRKMLVRGEGFTKHELVKWAKVWLEAQGFSVEGLRAGPRAAFAGSNDHVRTLERVAKVPTSRKAGAASDPPTAEAKPRKRGGSKTEYTGAKKGRGAFVGRKKTAKARSNQRRRRKDRTEVGEQFRDESPRGH